MAAARVAACAAKSPTPHGVGGLKFEGDLPAGVGDESHSPRSGWIEIEEYLEESDFELCPTPHGVGGLKFS